MDDMMKHCALPEPKVPWLQDVNLMPALSQAHSQQLCLLLTW